MDQLYKISLSYIFTLLTILSGVGLSTYAQTNYPGFPFLSRFNTAADSTRIFTAIDLGLTLREKNQDSALYYLNTALEESRKSNYTDGIGYALFSIGLVYTAWNNTDSAIHNFNSAITYCKNSLHHKYIVPAIYSNIGYFHYLKGNFPIAISYFDSSIREGVRIGLPKERKHLAITLNNLGGIHVKLKQTELALKYLDQAEDICRRGKFPSQLAMTLDNKASVYMLLHQEEKAEQYYQEGIKIIASHSDIESRSTLVNLKTGLADLKLTQEKPEEALSLLKEVQNAGYAYYKEYTSISPTYTMGKAYLQLKDYKQAEHYLEQALKESAKLDVKEMLVNIYKALTLVYDLSGNYAKALHYHYAYEQLKDSLLNREKAKDINELDIKYRTSEKDREIVEKKLQISQQQNRLNMLYLWIGGVSLGALLLGVVFISRSRINRQKQKSQARQIHILKQQQDLLKQQQEINHLKDIVQGEEKERIRIARELHDGIVSQLMAVRLHFNGALQYAGEIPNKEEFENTLQYLDEATRELRKTAHNLMPETVLHGGLITALHTHCDMMAKATGIQIFVQSYGDYRRYNPDVELSLYRIIQELLQNAIKHAQCTQVIIELHIEGNQLSITVEDDGVGLQKTKEETPSGIGLKSIYSRIKILKGKIEIENSDGNGTTVNMEFDTKDFY